MSWSERAHSLLRQGYSEAEAYAIVAEERAVVEREARRPQLPTTVEEARTCTADCCAVDDQEGQCAA